MTDSALDRRVARYPFPLDKDVFHYSTNVQPGGMAQKTAAGAWGESVTWVDPEEYLRYVSHRAAALDSGTYHVDALPTAGPATWDTALFLMETMSAEHPQHFRLERDGSEYVWHNDLLGIRQRFTYGDPGTLPGGPLDYIGRQATEDLLLLHEHDGRLWMDAGAVVFPLWLVPFTLGMSFAELHAGVRGVVPDEIVTRAERFIMRLEPGEVFRRTGWIFQPHDQVGHDIGTDFSDLFDAAIADPGRHVHLRTEVQHLVRLPRTGHILFMISTRLLRLAELASVPAWRSRTLSVLESLDPQIYRYKVGAGYAGSIEDLLRG